MRRRQTLYGEHDLRLPSEVAKVDHGHRKKIEADLRTVREDVSLVHPVRAITRFDGASVDIGSFHKGRYVFLLSLE